MNWSEANLKPNFSGCLIQSYFLFIEVIIIRKMT